jgi:hypothetical protein
MTQLRCPHESDVCRAVRIGFWSTGLREHADACPVCFEVCVVTEALLEESARIRTTTKVPDSAYVWMEARRRARLHLRHRANLWFRALRALTVIYVVASFAWLVSHAAAPASGLWRPSFHADFASLLTGPAEAVAGGGALLAALCITMGTWYLLREARQMREPSPGR